MPRILGAVWPSYRTGKLSTHWAVCYLGISGRFTLNIKFRKKAAVSRIEIIYWWHLGTQFGRLIAPVCSLLIGRFPTSEYSVGLLLKLGTIENWFQGKF